MPQQDKAALALAFKERGNALFLSKLHKEVCLADMHADV